MLNERGKCGAKIFSHYTDIVIFVLGYFDLAHPVDVISPVHDIYMLNVQCRINTECKLCMCRTIINFAGSTK